MLNYGGAECDLQSGQVKSLICFVCLQQNNEIREIRYIDIFLWVYQQSLYASDSKNSKQAAATYEESGKVFLFSNLSDILV